MNVSTIDSCKGYSVRIGRGISKEIHVLLQERLCGARVAVLSDRTVSGLHVPQFLKSFELAGIECRSVLIEGAEVGKTVDTVKSVYEQLDDFGFNRSDLIIGLGGGVVGDVAGFVAATFLRGVDYILVPTTLLSMVDSSIGGKRSVNFRSHKDLVGIRYEPMAVFVDPDFLTTLPKRQIANGIAEIIKFALVADPAMFEQLEQEPLDLDALILQSIGIKRTLSTTDTCSDTEPVALEFGHVVGHAIESHFRFLKYLHGEAIALGMLAAYPDPRLKALIERTGLPVKLEGVAADTIVRRILRDREDVGESLRLVELAAPGSPRLTTIPSDQAEQVFAAILTNIL